jgi:hydrogenase maturation factor
MEIDNDAAEDSFQEFITEVEYVINLNINSCDEQLVDLAKINMHDTLDKYILMHTNLVIQSMAEDGEITLM